MNSGIRFFGKWKDALAKVTTSLKGHHEYPQVIYDHVKPEIDARIAAGRTSDECPSCGFEAGAVDEILGELKQHDCMVCTNCDSYEFVIEQGGRLLCICCFHVYEHEEIHQCGWCGRPNGGDMEDSFWMAVPRVRAELGMTETKTIE